MVKTYQIGFMVKDHIVSITLEMDVPKDYEPRDVAETLFPHLEILYAVD